MTVPAPISAAIDNVCDDTDEDPLARFNRVRDSDLAVDGRQPGPG